MNDRATAKATATNMTRADVGDRLADQALAT